VPGTAVWAHQVAAKDYPKIGTQFADSRWPDLRITGLAYVRIATKLLTTHAYGDETVWFYERSEHPSHHQDECTRMRQISPMY
jgi:hypothetical protein